MCSWDEILVARREPLPIYNVRLNVEKEDPIKEDPLDVKKVIFNDPATIVLWKDGTKTVVTCQEGDVFDPEKGLALCFMKKALGNTSGKLNRILQKYSYDYYSNYSSQWSNIFAKLLRR